MKDKRRQFDASLAKVGDVVETRSGYKVRIICLDRQGSDYPVVGLLKDIDGKEIPKTYTKKGKDYIKDYIKEESDEDLVFPLKEYIGYINIYPNSVDEKIKNSESEHLTEAIIYTDKNKAIKHGKLFKDYITTIKITYKA